MVPVPNYGIYHVAKVYHVAGKLHLSNLIYVAGKLELYNCNIYLLVRELRELSGVAFHAQSLHAAYTHSKHNDDFERRLHGSGREGGALSSCAHHRPHYFTLRPAHQLLDCTQVDGTYPSCPSCSWKQCAYGNAITADRQETHSPATFDSLGKHNGRRLQRQARGASHRTGPEFRSTPACLTIWGCHLRPTPSQTVARKIKIDKSLVDEHGTNGQTPLMVAAVRGEPMMVCCTDNQPRT
eukprot:5049265-Pyramimonas_sp.AAC.1